MINEKNLADLKDKFEKIKHAYDPDNHISTRSFLDVITENLIPTVLNIDLDEGIKMWEEYLDYYYGRANDFNFYLMTENVLDNLKYKSIEYIMTNSSKIANYTYRLTDYESKIWAYQFLAHVIWEKNFELADILIKLIIQNIHQNNTPGVRIANMLDLAFGTDSDYCMTQESLGYSYKLLDLISDEKQRILYETKWLYVKDAVDGNREKGAMSLEYFSDGGFAECFGELNNFNSECDFDDKEIDELYNDVCSNTQNDLQSVDKTLLELNSLVGLETVKQEVESLTNMIKVRKLREDNGLKAADLTLHLVFSGNPGTGKTTVARILGKIYCSLGVLNKGHLIEVDRSGLVAGYVGQTALKTKKVIDSALGGVLFIDEAYSLVSDSDEDYGSEAIETILKAMEDNRDNLVVIVAGYREQMSKFINSNPGLKSRFNTYINFPDYNGQELFNIFEGLVKKNDYSLNEDVAGYMRDYFNKLYEIRDNEFGNARDVRNIFEKIVSDQADRVVAIKNPTVDEIRNITMEDLDKIASIL